MRSLVGVVAALAFVAAACTSPAGEQSPPPSAPASSSPTPSTSPTAPATSTTTSTTTSTSVPDPSSAVDVSQVGYLGCSVINNAVRGYEDVGGTKIWPIITSYGGGTVGRWWEEINGGGRGRYWEPFRQAVEAHPDIDTFWWGLCSNRSEDDTYEHALVVVDALRDLVPDAVLYVSAMPDYPDHVCRITQTTAVPAMQELTGRLVADGAALLGPVLGPLRQDQTSDGCHANRDGAALMGEQLVTFFGG